jgi:outer membrane protein assembly factor BamB
VPPSLPARRTALKLLLAQALVPRQTAAQTQVHRQAGPLSVDAVTDEWPSFLGPTHNAVSRETQLRRHLPPPLLWEFAKGTGYASPAIADNRLVFIHRLADEEVIECLDPESGSTHWRFRYDTAYRDRYGYNDGPRSSPVIHDQKVYTIGAEGKLHCLDLPTGRRRWMRDLRQDFGVSQDFFGRASTPLVDVDGEATVDPPSGRLIVNIGAPGGACVVALNLETGEEIWRAGEWGPSYSSPTPATFHGERRVCVFAGGESRPTAGGLMVLDPTTGAIDFQYPFRSRTYESVNASCPVVFGNSVFVSASYRTGGVCLDIQPDFTHQVRWTTPDFALHYNTAIHRDGYLYGFDGRNMGDASLACVDARTGDVVWREAPQWTENYEQGGRAQRQNLGTARGSLLAADGHFLCLGELGHLLWMDLTPDGYTEISRTWLFAARESWALPVLSRGLLYVVQNARDLLTGTGPRLLCYDLRA